MGEDKSCFFDTTFNQSVKVRSSDIRLSSDGGALLLREADYRLGLTESLSGNLFDPRADDNIRYTLVELLREAIYCLALGYPVGDDLDRMAFDPALKIAVWDRQGAGVLEERLASQPTHSRLIANLGEDKRNLEALRSALSEWVFRHFLGTGKDRPVENGTLDIDSFPIEVHGDQEGGAFNGYYEIKMYNPIVGGFSTEGDYDHKRLGDGFVHAILRAGNVASQKGAVRFIRHAYKKCVDMAHNLDVRFDAAFTVGSVLDPLTDDGIKFVGRIKKNDALVGRAAPYLKRPVGRPPAEGYEKGIEVGQYQASSWAHSQRLILVLVDKPDKKTGQLDLFPRFFFLITNYCEEEKSGSEILEHYRRRGTFEDRIGELRQNLNLRLSQPKFVGNEVKLLLYLLGFNLLSILRGELESESPYGWDMGRLQKSVLKVAARVTKGARRLFVDIAKPAVFLWKRLVKNMKKWILPTRCPPIKGPRRKPWIPPPPHAHLNLVLRE